MSEERANSRRPTSEASVAPAEDASLPSVSRRARDGERDEVRSTSGPGASEVVTVRMHRDGIAALTEVQRHLGGSRSDGVREAVQIVAEALSDAASIDAAEKSLVKRLAARRPIVVEADESVLADVREALREVADRYSRQAFLFQKLGNNWNQIAKVANSGGRVDPDALRGVERALDRLASVMERDAKRDATVTVKLREVL
ncbi:MobC family plasmid mobilization relaxosome protein [Arthrobacter sp. CAU 1506]|uniref:plasmid mobilization relaxosome protein MobC n=1 Tax=Arthrobacter sp. CAU 1506 TaxID=2560052 RepID=UPI0010ACC233|nr:plasmid mobilization relaxosome protein MobC [Arthrobacter sp. CAU 1506]TJY67337.1 MobC family plasmid mobilization relaxosome protein [Arthrobacter sp. CAU 1506]